MTGVIRQRPSAVSAIKVDGERAYDRVRAGEDVELAARDVTVSRFDVIDVRRGDTFVDVDVEVDCSSGTYIRALARDLGSALDVGGHLTALRRTRVGVFEVADACEPEDITRARLVAAATVARSLMPSWEVTDVEALDLGHGKRIMVGMADAPHVAAIAGDRLVAIVSVSAGVARVVTGFPHE